MPRDHVQWIGPSPATTSAPFSIADLVVTRYRENPKWLKQLVRTCETGGCWHAYIYTTSGQRYANATQSLCHGMPPGVFCAHVLNRGNEWSGYLTHLVHRYDQLAELTVFLQGDPFTVSPDLLCLLRARRAFRPVQALSWVQNKKRRLKHFMCNASFVGSCRVWIDPVSSGYRPLLHGDRYLAGTFSPAKHWKGILAPWAMALLLGPYLTPDVPATQLGNRKWLAARLAAAARFIAGDDASRAPPVLYRSYGAQFAASRTTLRALPTSVYAHILRWVHADAAEEGPHGQLSMGFKFEKSTMSRQKGLLLEVAWMTLLRASEHLRDADVCGACRPMAPTLKNRSRAKAGATCASTWYLGAPLFERCNISRATGPCGPHAHCPHTVNENADTPPDFEREGVHTWKGDDTLVPWPGNWERGNTR